uniref:Uncharacterized protein n=1 Tax=Timema poppense TaxID=170557 RepID=A0A7R9CS01_TIMPO|nr:unnamed protein product [Timema poppensis]
MSDTGSVKVTARYSCLTGLRPRMLSDQLLGVKFENHLSTPRVDHSASCLVSIAEPGSWETHLFLHVQSFRGGRGFGADYWPISAFGLASVFDLICKESVRRGHYLMRTRRVDRETCLLCKVLLPSCLAIIDR